MRQAHICTVLFALVLAACRADVTAPGLPPDSISRDVLTAAAAEQVDAQGHFRMRDAAPGELPAVTARAIADAFLKGWGAVSIGTWSNDRGARIDLATLGTCARMYYAEPVLDHASVQDTLLWRFVGPHWIPGYCDQSGRQLVSLSYSALVTGISVLAQPPFLEHMELADLSDWGIHPSVSAVPTTPEHAAAMVARASGVRVSAVPRLIMPAPPYVPQLAQWRVELEHPVSVTGATTAQTIVVDHLYVGTGEEFGQPAVLMGAPYDASTVLTWRGSTGELAALRVTPSESITFERVARIGSSVISK